LAENHQYEEKDPPEPSRHNAKRRYRFPKQQEPTDDYCQYPGMLNQGGEKYPEALENTAAAKDKVSMRKPQKPESDE
jgi:hypothetical protein